MFDWIAKWLENKIVDWLAKQLGVDPLWLRSVLAEVIAFLKEIFGAFGGGGSVKKPVQAIEFMREFVQAARYTSSDKARAALRKAIEEMK